MNSVIINSVDLSDLGDILLKNGDSCFIGKSSDYIAQISEHLDNQEIEVYTIKVSEVNDCDYLDSLALAIVTKISPLNHCYNEVRAGLDKIDIWQMEVNL